jgi:FdhE protein
MSRAPAADPVLLAAHKRLEALARQAPELAPAAAVQAAMLPHLRSARTKQIIPSLDLEAAQRCLSFGQPILAGQDLAFDAEAAGQLFRQLARAVETTTRAPAGRPAPFAPRAGASDSPVGAIHQAAKRGRLNLPALWEALAGGDSEGLTALANGAGLDVHWLRLLGENSLKPAFCALQAAVSQALDLADWQRGSCPVCGGSPLLAEVQGKEGGRRLRCGLCAAGWPYPRIKCSFCANKQHLSLGTLSLEGEAEKYRAQTCGVCRGYVKVVVTFDSILEDMLAVEDLATFYLDEAAAERGFSRAPVIA